MRYLIATLSILGVLATGVRARAQVIGQNAPTTPEGTFKMSVSAKMVVETVNVKDKQGKPIDGLTVKDFTVTEDGVPQVVKFVEKQSFSDDLMVPLGPPTKEDIKIYKQLNRTQVTTETPGSVKYKDKRLLAMYFDMTAMPPADQLRSLSAAEKFIRTQMTPSDLVAIFRYSGGSVDTLTDFTDNRDKMLSVLETMIVGEGQEFATADSDASSSDTGAAFGQDDGEFNIFNTDRQLAALQTVAQTLGTLNEKKALLYFASGLNLNGIDNQAQLHATIDAAVRAGVAFWPIDARGLVATSPLGDATRGSQGNQGMYTGSAAMAVVTGFQRSQDTMYALAADTGGKALFDNNDLTRGIVQAQKDITSYYIVGYTPTNTNLDGKFRKVKITVRPELEAKLDFRNGYYAGKVFGKFTTADKERQLEDALMLQDPVTDLTISMEINYFQLNHAEYFVPIAVKIPGRELALAKKGGADHSTIDFIGEIKDDFGGTTVQNVRDHADFKLSDADAAQLAKSPIQYNGGFTLLPGKYTIKFLARDDETGRIGTYQASFVIPNLNKVDKQVPMSSVVLSSQKRDMKSALFNAAKEKDQAKQNAANPLIDGNGMLLMPSVTRVFSASRNLYVYFQAYEPPPATPAGATPPATPPSPQTLVAFVSFYREGTKIFESKAVEVTPPVGSRLGMAPLSFDIGLKDVPTGQYDCQITVLNPAGQKTNFWRGPMLIVP